MWGQRGARGALQAGERRASEAPASRPSPRAPSRGAAFLVVELGLTWLLSAIALSSMVGALVQRQLWAAFVLLRTLCCRKNLRAGAAAAAADERAETPEDAGAPSGPL